MTELRAEGPDRIQVARGLIASALASLQAAAELLDPAQPSAEVVGEECPPHPPGQVKTISTMGDDPDWQMCLRCGERVA